MLLNHLNMVSVEENGKQKCWAQARWDFSVTWECSESEVATILQRVQKLQQEKALNPPVCMPPSKQGQQCMALETWFDTQSHWESKVSFWPDWLLSSQWGGLWMPFCLGCHENELWYLRLSDREVEGGQLNLMLGNKPHHRSLKPTTSRKFGVKISFKVKLD